MSSNRRTAQDDFNETDFLFATKGTFAEAFPNVAAAVVEYEISEIGEDTRRRRISGSSISEYLTCHNPLCNRGGFSIGNELRSMIASHETTRDFRGMCVGDEGSPKGRRPGRRCFQTFDGTITVQYREEADTTEVSD